MAASICRSLAALAVVIHAVAAAPTAEAGSRRIALSENETITATQAKVYSYGRLHCRCRMSERVIKTAGTK